MRWGTSSRLSALALGLCTCASADGGAGWTFEEGGYVSRAEQGFVDKCLPLWQEECRRLYGHDPQLREQLCENHLDRNYVKIRVMVPVEDILDRWAWFKDWHDFDVGFYKAHAPRFTDTGFQKAKLPDDLHRSLLEWYQNNRMHAYPEHGEVAFGMHCNTGHDNDDFVVPYRPEDPAHKDTFEKVKTHLMKLLSEWSGQDVNENTVTYGVRQYHRGSICGMHVDAPETHAFGVVYQLDQRGMDEPWAFNYVTHKGDEHKAFLQPGEVMLYEAASSLHGRKEPLRGDEFANIFFHFRSPNWMPGLTEMREKQYGPGRAAYEAEYSKAMGRQLYQEGQKQVREFRASDPCLPMRGRGMPLMVEGHFMDTPPSEDYDVDDYRRLMESQGTLQSPVSNVHRGAAAATSRMSPAASEFQVAAAAEPQLPGSSTAPTWDLLQARVVVPCIGACVLTVWAVLRRRSLCDKSFGDTHMA